MSFITLMQPAPAGTMHAGYARARWAASLCLARLARRAGDLTGAAQALDRCAFYRGFLEETLRLRRLGAWR